MGARWGCSMDRFFFVVAAALVSIEPWTPPSLAGLLQADDVRGALSAKSVNCNSAPEATDVAVLAALLMLRSISERAASSRH